MELTFRKAGDPKAPLVVHRHFAWNLGDKAFKGSPLEKHLLAKGKVAAMTKAASYLIWNGGFSRDPRLPAREHGVDGVGLRPASRRGARRRPASRRSRTARSRARSSRRPTRRRARQMVEAVGDAAQAQAALPVRLPGLEKHVHLMITAARGAQEMKSLARARVLARRSHRLASLAPTIRCRSRRCRLRRARRRRARTQRCPSREPRRRRPAAAPDPTSARRRVDPAAAHDPRPRIKDDGDGRLEKNEDTVAGGKHWRIKTAQGAVHVWVPAGYDRETAGTVVYVHGYWTDADGAWRDHSLARQFRASRQNALFIVPDAPSRNDEQVKWPALTDLRRAVTRANIKLPDGPIDRDGPLRRVPHGDAVGRSPAGRADHPARRDVRRRARVRRLHRRAASAPTSTS